MSVLITGASGGIGSAIARAFEEAGEKVALCYCTNQTVATKLEEELLQSGATVKAYQADLTKAEDVNALVQRVEKDLGPVHVLVNNAGVSSVSLLTDVTEEEYDRVMNANLKSAFLCAKAVLPKMIHKKSGVIINIASMWGEVGASCEVIYSASKAGLIGMTKALAKEVGPSGIRINCVSPGVIDTPMNQMHSPETMRELAEETPLQRIGTPEEVASAVLFLASDEASFITGQVLGVNGGMII